MHVHVETSDGEAKFWLEPAIEVATSHGLADRKVNEALKLVQEHQDEIRSAWKRYFGG